MFRIVRIFKLARHSGALKALGKTSIISLSFLILGSSTYHSEELLP